MGTGQVKVVVSAGIDRVGPIVRGQVAAEPNGIVQAKAVMTVRVGPIVRAKVATTVRVGPIAQGKAAAGPNGGPVIVPGRMAIDQDGTTAPAMALATALATM